MLSLMNVTEPLVEPDDRAGSERRRGAAQSERRAAEPPSRRHRAGRVPEATPPPGARRLRRRMSAACIRRQADIGVFGLNRVGVAAGATGAVAAGAFSYLLRRPLPTVDGELRVAGLSAPVEIVRDRWGIPHISARDALDAFFGQGFCHAQDRLWQMELARRFRRRAVVRSLRQGRAGRRSVHAPARTAPRRPAGLGHRQRHPA